MFFNINKVKEKSLSEKLFKKVYNRFFHQDM